MKELKIPQNFFNHIKRGEITLMLSQNPNLEVHTKLVCYNNDSGDFLNVELYKYLRGPKQAVGRILYNIYVEGVINLECWQYLKNLLKKYTSKECFIYIFEILEGDN